MAPDSGAGSAGRGDRGSAVTDFALVGGLLTLLFVAVLHLTLALYTRNILIDCAGEGARFGATADQATAAAADRTRLLIRAGLADRYADDVSVTVLQQNGFQELEVQVRAPLPILGLFGRSGTMQVRGHAMVEGPARAV